MNRVDSLRAHRSDRFKRVAIIHYWLVGMRGGERVLERLLSLFPDADIFTHVYDPEAVSQTIRLAKVRTTFIQRLPGARRHYQKYLPLMPMALEEIDLRGYDLVISSESGPAKGVIAAPDAYHVCYCHSPMRYLWDHYHRYRDTSGTLQSATMPWLFHKLRGWDVSSAARVDRFIANSSFIGRRIERAWGRRSTVVHPPVSVDRFRRSDSIGDHYLWVGQMTPYKQAELVAKAFSRSGRRLVMVGDGELRKNVHKLAADNITFIERLDFAALRRAYAECRALIFAAEEDFGIIPVEANAAGRPVLAYGKGGVKDSIIPGETGQFFDEQTVESLLAGLDRLEQWLPAFDPDRAVANAQRFAPARFDEGLLAALDGSRL